MGTYTRDTQPEGLTQKTHISPQSRGLTLLGQVEHTQFKDDPYKYLMVCKMQYYQRACAYYLSASGYLPYMGSFYMGCLGLEC